MIGDDRNINAIGSEVILYDDGIIKYFENQKPLSGYGGIILGESYIAVGETAKGITSIKTPNHVRMDNGEAVRDACIQGCGITLTATWCSYPNLESGELVQILPDYPLATDCALWAVYPSNRLLAPKVRAFIDFLAERFSGTPYWDEKLCDAVV